MASTFLSDLINPQVMGAMVSAQMPQAIKFQSIAPVDTTLVGRPGNTITLPKYVYSGSAQEVAEGAPISYNKLVTKEQQATIKKIVAAYMVTDEGTLSAYGDPKNEIASELRMAIASKVDNDILAAAQAAPLKLTGNDTTKLQIIDDIEAAFVEAPDAIEDTTYPQQGLLFLSYGDAAKLRAAAQLQFTRASALGDNVLMNGEFGEVLGWGIVRSKKIADGNAVAVKPGALKTFLKQDVVVDSFHDIDTQQTKFSATEYYTVAVVNDALVLSISPKA